MGHRHKPRCQQRLPQDPGQNPAIKGHNFNLAQPGATVGDLLAQAQQAVALKPAPGLFLVQIMDNDIICPATSGDYTTFRSKLITALGVLARGAPNSCIFVVSQWGSPTTYWKALRPAQRKQFGGTGPCAFLDPRGQLVPKELTRLSQRQPVHRLLPPSLRRPPKPPSARVKPAVHAACH